MYAKHCCRISYRQFATIYATRKFLLCLLSIVNLILELNMQNRAGVMDHVQCGHGYIVMTVFCQPGHKIFQLHHAPVSYVAGQDHQHQDYCQNYYQELSHAFLISPFCTGLIQLVCQIEIMLEMFCKVLWYYGL